VLHGARNVFGRSRKMSSRFIGIVYQIPLRFSLGQRLGSAALRSAAEQRRLQPVVSPRCLLLLCATEGVLSSSCELYQTEVGQIHVGCRSLF
jgi:hypothetical protein